MANIKTPSAAVIAKEIQKDLEGGRLKDIGNITLKDLYQKMNAQRSVLIRNNKYDYNSSYVQPFKLVYDTTIQDNPTVYVKFAIPDFLDIKLVKWISNDSTQSMAIIERPQLSTYNQIKATKPRPNFMVAVADDYLYVYGNLNFGKVQSGTLYMVAVNPFDVPVYTSATTSRAFDDELDPYPISGDLLPLLKANVEKEYGLVVQQAPQGQANEELLKQAIVR